MKLRTMVSVVAILVVTFFSHLGVSQGTSAPLSIQINLAQNVVPSGSSIKLRAEVTNSSAEVIRCSEAGVEFAVKVRDSTGSLMQETEKYREARRKPALRRVTIELAPGETRKWVFALSEMYDLSKPGEYSVQIGWNGAGTDPEVLSNTVGLTISAATSHSPEKPSTSFSLEIDAPQDVVKSASPIIIDIFATNATDHDLDLDNSVTLYSIEVRDRSQIELPVTEAGKQLQRLHGHGGGNHIHLKPGAVAGMGALSISDLYDIRQPGEYSIQITRMDEETKTLVKSNTINITVKP